MTDSLRAQLQASLGGAYSIERELGGGGMSRVFVARDEALGRQVVIKSLAPELAAGMSVERFAREVKLAARLQQANIVPVLSTGDADGLPWYAMPYVSGESLRARLAQGAPLAVTDAVHILRDVARALAYAHEQGIVHRDIKPDNILLSGGAAVVTDFGIAKALTASLTQEGVAAATLTQLGTGIGTPAYMAPEQSAGDPATDYRADIYAWGVVAWELLAGRHPFAGRSTPQAMLAAHMGETPPPLAAARPGVPPSLAVLVARCLEKDPAQRPASATELLALLDQVGAPSLSVASAGSVSRSTVRGVAIAAGVAAVAIGGWVALRGRDASDAGNGATGGATTVATAAAAERSLAVIPFESLGGDTANAYFAEGMADELTTALAKVPGLQLAGRSSAFTFKGQHASAREVGKALGVGAVLEGTVRRDGPRLRLSAQLTSAATGRVLWSETYDREANAVFALQDELTRAIVDALRVTLTESSRPAAHAAARRTTDLAAYDFYLRGLYFFQRRGQYLPRAVEQFTLAISRDTSFAGAHAGLALALTTLAAYTNTFSGAVLPRALAAAERAATLDPASAEAWTAIGQAQTYAWRWTLANEALHRAVSLDSAHALSRLLYGRLLLMTGQAREGLVQLQRAELLDPLNPNNVAALAHALAVAGRHAEALVDARRAFALDSTLLSTQLAMSYALVNGGRLAEARVFVERVMRYQGDVTMRGIGAYAIGRAGDTTRARTMALQLQRERGTEWRAQTALILAWLGARHTARALDAMERAADAGEPFAINYWLLDPAYDELRATPRFAAVVRRLGLDEARFTTVGQRTVR